MPCIKYVSRQLSDVVGNVLYWYLLNTIRMEFPELPG